MSYRKYYGTKNYRAITWDLDGCLHPTTKAISKGWSYAVYEATQEFNLGLTEEQCHEEKMIGFKRYGNSARHFEKEFDVPMWKFLEAMYRHMDDSLIEPYPGFAELLRANAHLPMAIVTSGTKPWSTALLKKLDFWGIIPKDRIITLEDSNGKTKSHAPDAYLIAARRLGVFPDQCMMIDNHSGNLIMANSLKMLTLLLDHSGTSQKDGHVDHIVTEPSQLFDLIVQGIIPWSGPDIIIPGKRAAAVSTLNPSF